MNARRGHWLLLAGVIALALWFFQPWTGERKQLFGAEAEAAAPLPIAEESVPYHVERRYQGLESPWDITFLDDRFALITLKPGGLLRVALDGGGTHPISGVPEVVYRSQGGLFSVRLHPEFEANRQLYLSYAVALPDGDYSTRVSRFTLDGDALVDQKDIFTARAASRKVHHFGGAMTFTPDGKLLVSIGDRGDRDRAQDLSVHHGKLVRLDDDGQLPADNPFRSTAGALPDIWSYGHRNPQGMAIDQRGRLWVAEHGPRGGDEINQVRPGRNYGWPVITYGKEYIGGRIGEGTHKEGMEQPAHFYVPSIATAGLMAYSGSGFPAWAESLFVAALRGHLNRVQLRDGTPVSEHRLLSDIDERVRAVREGPDGALWVLTENGSVLRLVADPGPF